jgi:uracil-DNA glycosylase
MIHIANEPFDLKKNWSIETIAKECTPWSWDRVFNDAKDELKDISEMIENRKTQLCPQKQNIFNAFHMTPLHKIKVVILSDSPYCEINEFTGLPRDIGLAYSQSRQDLPSQAIKNIFTELKNEYPEYQVPNHGNLVEWASRGVLLLNACLTTDINVRSAHMRLWMGFIHYVINALMVRHPNMIYLFWGNKCDDIKTMLNNKCVILEAGNPHSKYQSKDPRFAFLGCGHFRKVNDILKQRGEKEIDWSVSP